MKKTTGRLIKKYQNRRLYDTATSSYIIIDDVKQMLIDGEEVTVIDAKTSEDITRYVLLQIINDEENKEQHALSNDFLLQLIKFYGKAYQPSISPFLEDGLDLFKQMQKSFYSQIKDLYGKDRLENGVDLWRSFMITKGQDIHDTISNYIKNSSESFLQMQNGDKLHHEKILTQWQPVAESHDNGEHTLQ